MTRMERYAADEMLLFRRVVEHAVKRRPAARRTPEYTSRIAKRVLDCAATGERDPVELKIVALGALTDVDGRSPRWLL